ncbi:BRO family protein [Streptomyces roseifaciens]
MPDVMPLVFPETQKAVRVVLMDGTPWWVASDVCRVLDIKQPGRAVAGLDEDEVTTTHLTDNLGREQRAYTINESGLYSLILRSRKAEAKAFKRWITSEVLPQIRRTGGYGAPKYEIPQSYPEALMLAAAQAEELEAVKRQAAADQQAIAELTPKAEAAETYMASNKLLLVREVAKLLGIKERGLRMLLVERGFLFRRRNAYGDEYYDVAAKHAKAGYFVAKVFTRTDESGNRHVTYTIYVTPDGVEKIRRLLRDLADRANSPAIRHSRVTHVELPLKESAA